MGQITPFIEAPHVRPPQLTVSGGMNTQDIDHLRQGVSIRHDRDRYAGTMPKIGTGRNDHVLELTTYGQSSEFTEDPKWDFVDLFDPVLYIQNQGALIFPIILANATLLDPERLGGFIEPFDIGARDLIRVDGPYVAHAVHAHLMGGSIDSFEKANIVSQFICDFQEMEPRDVYIDSSDSVGTEGGDISIPGFFPEDEKILGPFDESQTLGKTYVRGSSTLTGDTLSALVAMTGSSTDSYLPVHCNSAGTGFTYVNTPGGVDSIAFGGLKR